MVIGAFTCKQTGQGPKRKGIDNLLQTKYAGFQAAFGKEIPEELRTN